MVAGHTECNGLVTTVAGGVGEGSWLVKYSRGSGGGVSAVWRVQRTG